MPHNNLGLPGWFGLIHLALGVTLLVLFYCIDQGNVTTLGILVVLTGGILQKVQSFFGLRHDEGIISRFVEVNGNYFWPFTVTGFWQYRPHCRRRHHIFCWFLIYQTLRTPESLWIYMFTQDLIMLVRSHWLKKILQTDFPTVSSIC